MQYNLARDIRGMRYRIVSARDTQQLAYTKHYAVSFAERNGNYFLLIILKGCRPENVSN